MKIILLLGPSSAGKSTLCAELVRVHGWHTHGIDQVSEILQAEQPPVLLEKLRELGLIERLSGYMSEAAITTLGGTGQLELVYGDISIKHQFNSPDFDGLETILSEAGFKGGELENLTRSIHEVGQTFKNLPKPNVLDRMLEDIFKLPPEASVILDLVPPDDGNIESLLHDFREKLLEHDPTIEFATVLAFCPPKALSTRIQRRNESAILSGNLRDKREGVFPFIQLSHLISIAKADGAFDEARTLSRMQLLLIALKHLPPGVGEGEVKKAKAIFKAGAHEYRELMRQFKLSDTSNVIVSPKETLEAHAVIDLSQNASPSDLARELITKTMDAPTLAITSLNKV
ncbi:hypothetical protein [Legionella anisa]|uniref:hypothetical protein n=1 Tax=Legionella anisa TaxID=28082 RepID=UPI001040E68D|nr:hypothetical protein [Legionella anisa]